MRPQFVGRSGHDRRHRVIRVIAGQPGLRHGSAQGQGQDGTITQPSTVTLASTQGMCHGGQCERWSAAQLTLEGLRVVAAQGSFALGVEEYVKQTEKKARSKVESRLRSTRMARVYGGATPPTGADGLQVSTGAGTPASAGSRASGRAGGAATGTNTSGRAAPPPVPPAASGASSVPHPPGSAGAGSGATGVAGGATPGAGSTSSAGRDGSRVRPRSSEADAHHARGFALRKKGDFRGAIAAYSEAIALDKNHFKAFFNRGA